MGNKLSAAASKGSSGRQAQESSQPDAKTQNVKISFLTSKEIKHICEDFFIAFY